MKKILIINTVYEGGGAAKVARDLFFHLNSQPDYEAFFAYGRGPKATQPKTAKFGNIFETIIHIFLVRMLGLEGYGSYFSTRKLLKLIDREKFDIIHLHNLHGYYLNFFKLLDFLKRRNITAVWTLHDEWLLTWLPAHSMGCRHCQTLQGRCTNRYDYPKNYFPVFSRYLLKKKIAAFSQNWDPLIICPSQWILESLNHSPFKNLRSVLIPNGIDTDIFKPAIDKQDLKNKLKLPADKKIILFLANSWKDKNKGVNFILEAANLLREKNYLFLGLGTKQIPETDNLKFINYLSDQNKIAEIFSLADIFCFPSAVETDPLSVHEALACGLPVVAFDIAALKDIVTKDTGFLVNYGDVKKMVTTLSSLLDDQRTLESMSLAAQKIGKEFSLNRSLSAYLEYYKK